MQKGNKGEWSELYAFIKLLKDGRVYAADENVEKIENIYFPIIKLIREEINNEPTDYFTGKEIKIYQNGDLVESISSDSLESSIHYLYDKIFVGTGNGSSGSFSIEDADSIMQHLHITKIKAPSTDKKDITMQLHDINTGYESIVGFSVKSDMGNPPTLLNAAKNTRFTYIIDGISDLDMEEINSVDKTVSKEYMRDRMNLLFSKADSIRYSNMRSDIFENNLIMIDSRLPELYGDMILNHYRYIDEKIYDCGLLCDILEQVNPLSYRKEGIYKYKFKKLLCAAALGMTPGTAWDGLDNASGGYIIIKRDGDVLCYHLYNRNFFEEYLLKNTQFDRPSATRHDYGYVYKQDNTFYIDLNVQIRFKSIYAATKEPELSNALKDQITAYANKLHYNKISEENLIAYIDQVNMPDRDKEIVRKYVSQDTTYAKIATEYEISGERVRQLIEKYARKAYHIKQKEL